LRGLRSRLLSQKGKFPAKFIENGGKAASRGFVGVVHLILSTERFEHYVNRTIVQMQAPFVG
jgi:hypothetical protein